MSLESIGNNLGTASAHIRSARVAEQVFQRPEMSADGLFSTVEERLGQVIDDLSATRKDTLAISHNTARGQSATIYAEGKLAEALTDGEDNAQRLLGLGAAMTKGARVVNESWSAIPLTIELIQFDARELLRRIQSLHEFVQQTSEKADQTAGTCTELLDGIQAYEQGLGQAPQ